MKMGIKFNWFIMTHKCWKLLKRVPKRINKAKRELVYYSLHLMCLFGGKTFTIKDLARGLITGMLSSYVME